MKNIQKIYFLFLPLFLIAGCSKQIDKLVVPIDNATRDLNQSTQKIDMPLGALPDTGLKVKGSKLVIEKHF